ncbi:MFS transporter [Streptomyces sp. NPDC005181]|uniref:MFS transporter n=1 Tax=Streptomyces sp. NPDC005181 TaxID=3156869 RepID=UPI0033B382A4
MTRPRAHEPAVEQSVLSRIAAFWLLGAIQLLLLFAASAPSPLYPVYQAEWGFSATTVTVVFALYAIALLLALLVVGALSDHVGRRPVLVVALILEAGSMTMFITAGGVSTLLLARALQGLATGAATGAITAGLVDLQPKHSPRLGATVNGVATTLGLAAGALGSGLLVQYAPAPTTLIFVLLTAAFAVTTVGVFLMPETSERRPGALASLRPTMSIPPRVRPHFAISAPSLVALWALGGFHLSLGPALTVEVLHVHSHLATGIVISILTGMGAVGAFTPRHREPRQVLTIGSLAMIAGMATTILAVVATVPVAYLLGTAVAGFGYGASFLGAFGTIAPLATPKERAALFSTVYVVSYASFSLPAIAAGVMSTQVGLRTTATFYAAALIALAAAVLVGMAVQRRREASRDILQTPPQRTALTAGEPSSSVCIPS